MNDLINITNRDGQAVVVLVRIGSVAICKEPSDVSGLVYEVHLENEDPLLFTEEQFAMLAGAVDAIRAARV